MTKRNTSPSLFSAASESALVDVLFDSIGDGAIATDEFGKIARVNAAALQILGYRESELIGAWFPAKIIAMNENGTPASLINRPITKAFLTGHSISEKAYYCHKDGSKIPVSITVSPIILYGKPVGAINLFRDISLEFEVDRMKSEFISLASHQLRTPLTSIKTYSHMLIDGYMGEISPRQRSSLRTIVDAADRMNQLISTLLNISRIESGAIVVRPKLLNLNVLAAEAVKELRQEAADKSIALELRTPKQSRLVRSDRLIIKEILSNLVSNAIKYTPEKGTVTLTVRAKDDDILCSVADTGIGIPKGAQEQIFSKFFRAQNVIARESSGTGLGLYLVKGLAERLGAQVWFESQVNKGTTFYLSLPAYKRKPSGKIKHKPV